ncbi:prepilin-type N-terminal cleavage/methylation domain-containing protein [Metasolibacillus meyeri]|uniref:Prepilin-type N-terminal cleavage/methylation domain-containing protein n=1 Tax=Metasolibacillus meyeri TaxID=1071052 RepID=A0AAW9NTX7_9BACL|nr:prepilin-type N-terminal cleavage/methylation domain-containing protein [Metasolibacillus meyeri]MEC1179249.1 prepilin-type N-terminal cleavage/methylation domain-containing protein [Metasolibacillus meyeri]
MIKHLKNNQGMSLIEVVAALLIIGIMLISFFGLLIQSNKTTHKSHDIMDATYMAQIEMENLYNAASGATSYESLATSYILDEETTGTKLSSETLGTNQVHKYLPRESEGFAYYLTLETFAENSTYKSAVYVHLEVIENSTNSKATMENVYILGGT